MDGIKRNKMVLLYSIQKEVSEVLLPVENLVE